MRLGCPLQKRARPRSPDQSRRWATDAGCDERSESHHAAGVPVNGGLRAAQRTLRTPYGESPSHRRRPPLRRIWRWLAVARVPARGSSRLNQRLARVIAV